MNGMILYPTDDEIEILARVMLIENAPEFMQEEFVSIEAQIGIIFAVGIINAMFKQFCDIKPLKINETVLG